MPRAAYAAALVLLAACLPESVESVTLTPTSPDVEAVLLAADARWEAAGVAPNRIVIGPGGAPVRFTPENAPVSETVIIGRGSAYTGVRAMNLSSLAVDIVTHEMGHALGITPLLLEEDHLHGAECEPGNDRPMMCEYVGSLITWRDLGMACDVGACVAFAPEDGSL